MRTALLLLLACLTVPLQAQEDSAHGPANQKAQNSYAEAHRYVAKHWYPMALEAFKLADKQDGGHCSACQKKILEIGEAFGDWKAAENAAQELLSEAQQPKQIAIAHYQFGSLLLHEATDKNKDSLFHRSHEEFLLALAAVPRFPNAAFADGRALAYLNQDEEAGKRFRQFLDQTPANSPEHQRALLYLKNPDLARATMAPPFTVTTLDGQHLSLDALQGKVVLIDFWATWCVPCVRALPHLHEIAKHFDGQPLLVLSVSLDTDEDQWKEFIAKNEMTWPQYLDHGFTGPVAQSFGVFAIPHTFTIDADGILQDEHVGDSSIDGKLKKLVKRAQEKSLAATAPQP